MAVITRSVAGYKNLQKEKPNNEHKNNMKMKDVDVMCVAEGLDSDDCLYGGIGAKIATETALEYVKTLRGELNDTKEFSIYLKGNKSKVFDRFYIEWVKAVLKDYAKQHIYNPDVAAQVELLIKFVDSGLIKSTNTKQFAANVCDDRESLVYEITSKYATSINIVLITDHMVYCMGIGSGDVIVASDHQIEWMLPKSQMHTQVTASLGKSYDEIIKNLATRYMPISQSKRKKFLEDMDFDPTMIVVSSDGLRDAFTSDERFIAKMIAIADGVEKRGVKTFSNTARKWITELSQNSPMQDDISFCIYFKYQHRRK